MTLPSMRVLFGLSAIVLSAVVSCSSDPVYLGVSVEPADEQTRPPYSCDPMRRLCFIDPGVSGGEAEVEAVFDVPGQPQASEFAVPTWHYPLEGSVHARNLGLLTLHFEHAGRGDEIFELIIGDDSRSRRVYFPCLSAGGNGCVYQVPELFWIEAANNYAGRTVPLYLRAGNSAGISKAALLTISFSPSDVKGGLYYWSAELEGVYRLVFGGREAVPYVIPGTPSNTQECAGCHAVSRDGSTIAFSQGSSEPGEGILENAAFEGALKVAPVTALENASIDPVPGAPSDSGMMSLSSDGSRVASAYDFKLELRSAETGAVLDEVSDIAGKQPFFPEFSPDDQWLAVTLTGESDIDSEIGVRRGAIAILPVAGDVFGEATIVVPEDSEVAHYYPTWSPDGNYLAFVSGPAGVRSYDQEDSELKLVSVETGEVFDLARATGAPGMTSTWPKFAPFRQCPDGSEECPAHERMFFLSFSSKRQYGLVANLPGDFIRSQLWMSAIDLRRAESGADPSSAPFWVPYQAHDTRNHLGYWTEVLRCNEIYPCGSGQVCEAGECIIVVR